MITIDTIKNILNFEKPKEPDLTFAQIALPLVRSVWPTLVSSQFVSVQPMIPSSPIFYLDFKYAWVEEYRTLYEMCQYINQRK